MGVHIFFSKFACDLKECNSFENTFAFFQITGKL